MKCPRCQSTLSSEEYEGVEIDRCGRCHGAWLDAKELNVIVKTKEKTFGLTLVRDMLDKARTGVPSEERDSVELCPVCSTAMSPVNYGMGSGVIVDNCPKGHGVWCDAEELEKVQAFKEHSDEQYAKNKKHWNQIAEKAGRQAAEDLAKPKGKKSRGR